MGLLLAEAVPSQIIILPQTMLATILVASNLAMSANYTWCEPTTDHGCFDDKGQQGGYGWKGKGSRRVVARQYFLYLWCMNASSNQRCSLP